MRYHFFKEKKWSWSQLRGGAGTSFDVSYDGYEGLEEGEEGRAPER